MLVTRPAQRLARPPGHEHLASSAWQAEGAVAWYAATISVVLAATLSLSRPLSGDAFFDLYAGRYIATHGLPHGNVFTVTAHGAPWIDQQWLAHLIYYGVWTAGGYPALVALSSALVTGGFAMLALAMLRRGVPPVRMFGWTAAAFAVSAGDTEVRAQSFGYLFLGLTLWLVLEDSQNERPAPRTWLILPVLVAWANTHGSALQGAGLAALYAGFRAATTLARGNGRAFGSYAALCGLAVATVVCTPYGLAVIGYYRSFLVHPLVARYNHEFWPPSIANPWCWPFFAMILATVAALAVAWRRGARPDPLLAGLLVILLVLALRMYKDMVWFGFGASLLAADTLARASAGRVAALGAGFRRVTAAALVALALAAAVVLSVTPGSEFQALVPWRAMGAAVRVLGPRERVLTDDWTGAAMLALHPAMLGRIGFDVRTEQYTAGELSAMWAFFYAKGAHWQRVLNRYRVVVVSRSRFPLAANALARLPGWRVLYNGRDGIVVQRTGATR